MSDTSASSSYNVAPVINKAGSVMPSFRTLNTASSTQPQGHPPPPPPSAFSFSHTRIASQPPILDLDFGSRPSSMFTDMLGQFNSSKSSRASDRSFNQSLNQSTRSSNRTTFDFAAELAALTASAGDFSGDTLHIARSIEFSTESPDTALAQLEEVLESRKNSAETLGRNRRSNPPFQGRIEFQMGVRARSHSRPSPGLPPPFALPPTPTLDGPLQNPNDHRKQPSAISFASMSSLGAPLAHIDRGHINYFEQAFAAGGPPPPLPPLPPISSRVNASHHRRMSSEVSIDSVLSAETSMVTGRASRCHHRESSTCSFVGRSDWASQRRASRDSESLARLSSIARLGRPGIGERMFEGLDRSQSKDSEHGISFVGSPTFGTRPYSFASSTDETAEPVTEEGVSFFGTNHRRKPSFAIQSRPLSLASLDESRVNDTFDFVDGPSKRGAVEIDVVDAYTQPSPAPETSTPHSREVGVPRARHRPPALYLCDGEEDTPSLISPSDLTEVSSIFSLDTARASNPPLGYPSHRSGKGSVTSIVQVHPTIREEASRKDFRESRASDDSRAAWELVQELNARHWNDLGDVASSLLTRSPGSDLYTHADAPPVPHTRAEIEAILADSQASYKPLDNASKGEQPAGLHRRKTSLSDSRAAVAPYILQPAPLETRFRSKRSSGERVSPLLAEFARDVSPLPRSRDAPLPNSEAKTTSTVATAPAPPEVRPRVPSAVRRDNLGWARRRNSDEPAGSAPHMPRKAPVSVTMGSYPTFLAFSPAPRPEHTQPEAKTASSRPTHPRPLLTANVAPKRAQKRIHVKTDSNGSPMSLHSTSSRTCLTVRADSAPLAARSSNIPQPRRVFKTKSSPEIRRKGNKENVRAPAPAFVLAPPPLRV
ncbi:hypothetical protein CC85DRAFT_286732 [Cutaneotrichosporon oleaginosum]|uniref:Uncharacterized protein n=1 Tax=Cutaneotrichosporon oleaginosum TaxID=879819 RepID=A0A0J0XJA7_9TREE|nr:uncharacterized protein CC85DRAFT_286732 [Cutaneotrichosporon oleaginosum]KLT41172.1 hypothetical protein CC85DRAFT_286732 [Cutaneotrichosporon oleaginosum]TXT14110.1 hypothetical protein COLE_00303 [Cutaneotrichosporon oleaginosum]